MARIEELPEDKKVAALFNGAEGVGGLVTMLMVRPSSYVNTSTSRNQKAASLSSKGKAEAAVCQGAEWCIRGSLQWY